jgi:hypothetical protein
MAGFLTTFLVAIKGERKPSWDNETTAGMKKTTRKREPVKVR